jgi:hypothetical protein
VLHERDASHRPLDEARAGRRRVVLLVLTLRLPVDRMRWSLSCRLLPSVTYLRCLISALDLAPAPLISGRALQLGDVVGGRDVVVGHRPARRPCRSRARRGACRRRWEIRVPAFDCMIELASCLRTPSLVAPSLMYLVASSISFWAVVGRMSSSALERMSLPTSGSRHRAREVGRIVLQFGRASLCVVQLVEALVALELRRWRYRTGAPPCPWTSPWPTCRWGPSSSTCRRDRCAGARAPSRPTPRSRPSCPKIICV